MIGERSQVTWGTTTIPYAIRRSARRATVSLAVDPVDGLLVTAPEATSVARLDSVVRRKARWVVERLRRRRDEPAPPGRRELVSGETFLYLGRQYRLRLLPGERVRPLALRGGWLELPVPEEIGEEHRSAYARAALVDWYRRLAAEHLPAWTAPWAKKLAVPVGGVLIADQGKRWGSCSRGILRFNWRIIQAPRSVVDYVLAHEVVHLVQEHHGREFWSALGRVMPDYDVRKARLRDLGSRLEW